MDCQFELTVENVVQTLGILPDFSEVAVVTFDSEPTLLQDFTADTDIAADAIASLKPGCTRQHHLENCESPDAVHNVSLGDNGAAILDSLNFSVDLLRKQPNNYRRAILLISETLDRGSHIKLEDALRSIAPHIQQLADKEGLTAHRASVDARWEGTWGRLSDYFPKTPDS